MPVTKTAIAATRTTATIQVARRSCSGMWRRADAVVARMHRNESITPEAARSCRNWLTFTGISPTPARWTPADTTRIVSMPERLRARRALMRRSSAATRKPTIAMPVPARKSVALKTYPEKSSNVPSVLNMLSHQVWSVVVRMESAMPVMSTPTEKWRRRLEVIRATSPEGMLKVGTCIRSTRRPDLPASG
jgi:hypothetical protein